MTSPRVQTQNNLTGPSTGTMEPFRDGTLRPESAQPFVLLNDQPSLEKMIPYGRNHLLAIHNIDGHYTLQLWQLNDTGHGRREQLLDIKEVSQKAGQALVLGDLVGFTLPGHQKVVYEVNLIQGQAHIMETYFDQKNTKIRTEL